MKSYVIATGIAASIFFSSFASAASFTSTCTNLNKDSDEEVPEVVKIVVDDDWQGGYLFMAEQPNIRMMLECNGPKSEATPFTCTFHTSYSKDERLDVTFTWGNENKMNLQFVSTDDLKDDGTYETRTDSYECVKT